ncbi:unnamed protein product, partial [Brenthis ino]
MAADPEVMGSSPGSGSRSSLEMIFYVKIFSVVARSREVDGVTPLCLGDHVKLSVLRLNSHRSCRRGTGYCRYVDESLTNESSSEFGQRRVQHGSASLLHKCGAWLRHVRLFGAFMGVVSGF